MPLARAPLLKGRSGNYVVARQTGRCWEIVSNGEAADLGDAPWGSPAGEEMVLIRFNVSRTAREAELADLCVSVSGDTDASVLRAVS